MPRMIRASVAAACTSFPDAGSKASAASPSGLRPAADIAKACATRARVCSADPGRVPSTARSAHMSAWSERPEMTIQFASDVAARAPISDSVPGSWLSHAASRRFSASADPV